MRRTLSRLLFAVAVLVALTASTSQCGPERVYMHGYTTGYGWWDNNPPRSADICCPAIHGEAGGTGTYENPLTVAVDYSSGTTMQFPPGTVFYVPNVRAYLIVEDRTGEQAADNSMQHGQTNPHLDLWTDGRTSTAANADACERSITLEGASIIVNPASNYAVVQGPIAHDNTCRQNYGNGLTTT